MIFKKLSRLKPDHYLKRVTVEDVNDANKFKLPASEKEILEKIEKTQTVTTYPNRLDKNWYNSYLKKYMQCRQPSGYRVLRSKEDEFKFHCIPAIDEVKAAHRRVHVTRTFDPRIQLDSSYNNKAISA